MNLHDLLPALPDDVRTALHNAGISSAHDIVFAELSSLYSRLPPGVLSLRTLSDLRTQVVQLVSAPPTRGNDLFALEEACKNARELCMCGVDELDALLRGFGHHAVIEIAGGKRSGKTERIVYAAVKDSHYSNHAVFWLDVGGELVVERVAEILRLNPGTSTDTALDRLSVSACFGVAEAYQALEELRTSLEKETSSLRTRFIVIDPLTPLFAPILNAISSQGHAVMTTFMRLLSSLARTYALTVLITNTAVQAQGHNPYSAFKNTTTKPALGPSFTFLTDETLWLARVDTSTRGQEGNASGQTQNGDVGVFVAEVFRSRSTLSQTWCAFVIRDGVSFEPFVRRTP